MTKQEVMNILEEIKDKVSDVDTMEKFGTEGIVDDITDLQWQLNVNTDDFE
jgi:hypothetical protein